MKTTNDNFLITNSLKILMFCRKPTTTYNLRKDITHNGSLLKYNLDYLKSIDMLESNDSKITLTEKGKKVVELWIEINKLMGINICQYS